MKKYFVVTDVHSFYDEMMKALNDAGFDKDNPDHIFVSCGDMFDRGPKSYECLQFVNSLPEDKKILVRGNHEDLLDDVFVKRWYAPHDKHNGTNKTVDQLYASQHQEGLEIIASYDKINWLRTWEEYRKYEMSLVDYARVGNYIFVHGWVPYWAKTVKDLEEADRADWKDARWDNGMRQWRAYGSITNESDELMTIVCGHWHSSFGHSLYHKDGVEFLDNYSKSYIKEHQLYEKFTPFIDDGIVALDACTAYTGFVNCYVFEETD